MQGLHENSIKSIKRLKVGGRHNRILQLFHIYDRPLTDREVKIAGKFEDMNEVRPRITELCSKFYGKRLKEIGDITCPITKLSVRQTRLSRPEERTQPELF